MSTVPAGTSSFSVVVSRRSTASSPSDSSDDQRTRLSARSAVGAADNSDCSSSSAVADRSPSDALVSVSPTCCSVKIVLHSFFQVHSSSSAPDSSNPGSARKPKKSRDRAPFQSPAPRTDAVRHDQPAQAMSDTHESSAAQAQVSVALFRHLIHYHGR